MPPDSGRRPAVAVQNVSKQFRTPEEAAHTLKERVLHPLRRSGHREFVALRDVSFEVEKGEFFGIVGRNGSGKSTLLKCIAGIYGVNEGRMFRNGRMATFIELGVGFNPDLAAYDNVVLNGIMMGLTASEAKARYRRVIEFAELEDFQDLKLKNYSSGMHMRLAFAVATHVDAEILLVDEILAVGDEAFQRKCFDWLEAFKARGGTIVLVSHNLGVVREICDEVAWIDNGSLRELGHPNPVVSAYLDHVRGGGGSLAEVLVAEQAQGRSRPQVKLGALRVLDPSGIPVLKVATGSTLTLEVDFTVDQPLAAPVFGVALFNAGGTCIYATNNREDGVELASLVTAGTLRVQYPDLALLPGRYLVTVSVFSAPRSDTIIDSLPMVDAFEVETPTREAGLVRLPHAWSVTSRSEIPS